MEEPIQQLQRVVDQAVAESEWISWEVLRRHLEVQYQVFNRFYDPFTFVLIRHYLHGYVSRIAELLRQLDGSHLEETSKGLTSFIQHTFLNHLLDCDWASFTTKSEITHFVKECQRCRLMIPHLQQRFEYLERKWVRMENGQTDDSREFVSALHEIQRLRIS